MLKAFYSFFMRQENLYLLSHFGNYPHPVYCASVVQLKLLLFFLQKFQSFNFLHGILLEGSALDLWYAEVSFTCFILLLPFSAAAAYVYNLAVQSGCPNPFAFLGLTAHCNISSCCQGTLYNALLF